MIEELYLIIKKKIYAFCIWTIPYFRRFIRFCALPYCFFSIINWELCPRSRLHVAWDLLYIFFRLRYFPENYSLCHLWEKDRKSWKNYYGSIYDAFQRGRLRREVQKKEYEILFEDKNVCYQLCKAAGFPVPFQHACLHPTDNYHLVIKNILTANLSSEIIIKPVFGKGGKDVFLANYDSQVQKILIYDTRGNKITIENFRLNSYSVIQERVKQHPKLSGIAPSVNTFRIVTILTKSEDVLFLGSSIRFGRQNRIVDNTSSGGIGVGIYTSTGTLMREGFDSNGISYISHPASGVLFEGFQIPKWHEILELAKKIQKFFSYYRLLGHDIALTNAGPVIIEINAAHDNIMLEQNCGPILAKNEVRYAFEEYNLLIN